MTDADLVALLLTEARAKRAYDRGGAGTEFVAWTKAFDELRAAVLGRLEAERGQA